nr:NAD(P)-dependent oxidoreductase [uncultured Undibacterium sp.]
MTKYSSLKVAVTGASGFVGRHVLNALIRYDLEIIAVTRDAKHLVDYSESIQIIEMDIYNPIPDKFQQICCADILMHLAWDGLPNYRSLHHFETELPRQYQFLKSVIEAGVASLMLTGTCFEYGMQHGPLSEDIKPQPDNSYGYAKDGLRQQLEFLKSIKSFNLTWARLFYMYGDGQPLTSLYPMLKNAVLNGEKKFNMSGGEQLRDYLPVEVAAGYLVRLALARRDFGIVNVCSGTPISVRKLVEQWIDENKWGISNNFGYYPYPSYEPMAFWGNRNRLDALLEEQ